MKIANAPCSWGILEFGLEGKTDKYTTVLDEMSSCGYMGTELGDWGFLPTNSKKLDEELKKRKLCLVGAFVPINFLIPNNLKNGVELALKTARLLSDVDSNNARIVLADDNGKDEVRTQNAGRIKSKYQFSNSQWKTFADGVEHVSRIVFEETGVPCSFHHHCAGHVETPNEINTLLERTDPDLVNLCFDTGHYAFGGGNPLKGLKKHFQRIDHVHFKDFDKNIHQESVEKEWDYFEAIQNGIFCELGKGSINFDDIVNELKDCDYKGWIVVEQDVLPGMGSPQKNANRNRDFLKTLGI